MKGTRTKTVGIMTLTALVLSASIAAAQAETDQQATLARSASVMQSPFPDDYDEIEAENWRTIKLTIDLSHGGRCDITLLRPLPWIRFTGASVGNYVDLQMPEMGIAGQARVTAIEPCPETHQSRKPGTRPVIGKFVTTDVKVVELSIVGLDDPIGTTASHPFWSMDRNDWVAAGDLRQGETLRTIDGTATVAGLKPRPGVETVYNLEVHKDHTFFVSDAKLWVHNTCTKAQVRDLAKWWGLKGPKVHPKIGRGSRGEEWFTDGKLWYTFDNTGHRGGVWKVFDRKGNRKHTVDIDGNIVGD